MIPTALHALAHCLRAARTGWRPLLTGVLASVVALPFAAPSLAASSAFRCTDAQGHVQYRQTACPTEGRELTGLDDARTPSQQRQAADMAHRDHMLVQRMARDRRHLERQAEALDVQHLGPTAAGRREQAKQASADPHAPVPTYRCRPPKCYEARVPKARGQKNTPIGAPAVSGTSGSTTPAPQTPAPKTPTLPPTVR